MMLDRAACEFEQWAAGRSVQSVLYDETNTLQPEQREEIARQIAAIRSRLRRLKADFNLASSHRNASTTISARCATLWEALIELEASRLDRYGPLPAGAAERLDDGAKELLARVEAIMRCVSR